MPPATYSPLPPPPPSPSHTPQPPSPAPLQYSPQTQAQAQGQAQAQVQAQAQAQAQQLPAAKRPKLASPYPSQPASPSPISPHGTYNNPPLGSASYNTMSAMLPPPPPSQQASAGGGGGGSQPPKATDTNELADALASAGIDLKEEEAHLSMPMTASFPGLNPHESLHIRRNAELKANHALDPFIDPRVLHTRIRAKAKEQNMTLSAQQGIGIVSQDITTFLSLAMRERVHGLITRSIVLARQRRAGNGMISGEWGAFVKGGDKHQSIITNGDGNFTLQNPLKRSFSTYSNPSSSLPAPQTRTTTSISNETARALRLLAQQELQAETLRLQQKALKATSSTSNSENPTSSPAPESAASSAQMSTPGPGGIDSITSDPPRKLSAKETRKNQDIRVQEAVAHRAANSTAAMMMGLGGAFGGKKKKYAWMMAGTPGGAGSTSAAGGAGVGPSRGGAGGTGGAGDPGQIGMTEAVSVWGKRIGEWREDGEKGLGVQIRDWAGALEGDGRERKAVVRAYIKMK